jgi:hypothetical protein
MQGMHRVFHPVPEIPKWKRESKRPVQRIKGGSSLPGSRLSLQPYAVWIAIPQRASFLQAHLPQQRSIAFFTDRSPSSCIPIFLRSMPLLNHASAW